MDDRVFIEIEPSKLKLAYDEFLKVSKNISENRDFFINLGEHGNKIIILKWSMKVSGDGIIRNL